MHALEPTPIRPYGVFGRPNGLGGAAGVQEIEALGYGTVWLVSSLPDAAEPLLAATDTLRFATGITNVWTSDPREVAVSCQRLESRYPGRFLLGVGVGHPEATKEYAKPYEALQRYLDVLDDAGIPASARVLAALGPRVLGLARDRSAGAHPYLTTPEHTRQARDILGPERLLVPEHKIVASSDPEQARAIGRPRVATPYLGLRNYVSNLRRLGWDEADVAAPGSDALIDALVAYGTPEQIAARLREHLDAGADQVAIQVLPADDEGVLPALRALAPVLFG